MQDLIHIERQLGYTYKFSMPQTPTPMALSALPKAPKIKISNIDRSTIQGSFIISAWTPNTEERGPRLLGVEAVLSRWNVAECENCQRHLEVETWFQPIGLSSSDAKEAKVFLHTRRTEENDNYKGPSNGPGGQNIKVDVY